MADVVRGQPVNTALNVLKFMPKKGAELVYKVLWSAIANAQENKGLDVDELKVARILIDEAPVLKRFAARAKGRGTRIVKRNSHITVAVSEAGRTKTWVRRSIRSASPRHHARLDVEVVCRARSVPGERPHGFPRPPVPARKLAEASVSRILIERAAKKVNITIQTARPGIVIGKKGEDIEKLRQATAKLLA